MRVRRGDLIVMARAGDFDVVVHGCNCQCTMGAGIAKAIRTAFPAAFDADCATAKGDRGKLGTISTARVEMATHVLTVVNAYTQFHWRGKAPLADYDAIRRAFATIRTTYDGQRIGYPRIRVGLAGGDWAVIAAIIDEELHDQHHTLVEFAPDG